MKNHSISKKLFGAFGAMFVLILMLASTSFWIVGNMKDGFDRTSKGTVRKLVLSGEINAAESEMFAAQRGMIMNTLANRTENLATARTQFERSAAELEKHLDEFTLLLVTDAGKRLMVTIRQGVTEWKPLFEQVARECEAHRGLEAIQVSDKIVPLYQALGKYSDDMTGLNYEIMKKEQSTSDSQATTARIISVTLLIMGLSIGCIVLYAVRQISAELRQVAGAMSESAEQVASASTQVATSSQALAQGSSEQAASLEETSASAEEITSMTRKNADNSRDAANLMGEVDQHVSSGNKTLEQMVGSMHSINESSEKVSRIIKVIDEIAFQTNILALNAAVEAARAGEAGMGFAVVADEVRSLAQRSAQAAKDTASLIEESISRSKEGSTNLESVAGVIRSITESAGKVKTLVDEVSLGSQEQARGIEQIAKAITQMDQVTQQNAANAEESASASHELSAQAESMRDSVMQLQAMVGGSMAHKAPVARRARPKNDIRAHTPIAHKMHVPPAPQHTAGSSSANDMSFDDFKDF